MCTRLIGWFCPKVWVPAGVGLVVLGGYVAKYAWAELRSCCCKRGGGDNGNGNGAAKPTSPDAKRRPARGDGKRTGGREPDPLLPGLSLQSLKTKLLPDDGAASDDNDNVNDGL
jgi:hypothetical protein